MSVWNLWQKLLPECNSSSSVIAEIRKANTARHVSEIINKNNISGFFDMICKKVYEQMYEHSKAELPGRGNYV